MFESSPISHIKARSIFIETWNSWGRKPFVRDFDFFTWAWFVIAPMFFGAVSEYFQPFSGVKSDIITAFSIIIGFMTTILPLLFERINSARMSYSDLLRKLKTQKKQLSEFTWKDMEKSESRIIFLRQFHSNILYLIYFLLLIIALSLFEGAVPESTFPLGIYEVKISYSTVFGAFIWILSFHVLSNIISVISRLWTLISFDTPD